MKQTKNDAVATVKNVQPIDVASMKAIIGADLDRAEVGMFCMLRAGVGLLVYKAMSEHGDWEQRLMELCPGKSARTLQMYMKQARELCEARQITPEQAWDEASKIDASQVGTLMLAAPAAMQIGTGEPEAASSHKKGRKGAKAEQAPGPDASAQTFSQMLIDFIQQRKAAKAKDAEPPKPLTKREKVEAAIIEASRIVNTTADWLADGTWALLPDDELESTLAGIRSVADRLRDEFKSRS